MKKDEISEGLADSALASSSQITLNNAGTCTKGDTGLTQRRSPDVLRDLLVKRRKVGPETIAGRLLSNIIKQALWQDDPDSDRSWAKHPTHNLPWMMNVQVEALAKGSDRP